MEQRLSLVTLGAKNLKQLTKFYTSTFGWRPLTSSNDSVTFFQLNGFQLGIFGYDALAEDANVPADGHGFKGFSLAYNLRTKAEVDELFTELKAKGVAITKEPQEVFWGGYSGYIADPENNLWEIAYNPYMDFDENGNVMAPNK